MTVSPKMFPLDDPFATINQGNMGVRFTFKNSQEIFISAQFNSPRQTAYAVLNDMIKADK
jgi:homoserine dehydrogenase